jgi:hypothetical protein
VAAAPYAIAPERAIDLEAKVFLGKPWGIVFGDGANSSMKAMVDSNEIWVPYSGLLSLWAATRAVVLIGTEAMAATRKGQAALDSRPGTAVADAIRLREASASFIRNSQAKWPSDLPTPDSNALEGCIDWHVNNVFLGACGWILLHEIAHMHLSHAPDTSADLRKKQEREADEWATKWILDHAPQNLQREFRLLSLAASFTWLGLNDGVMRVDTTHPHAWERFGHCTNAFKTDALSPGLELAAYVVKVCFFPAEPISPAETPEEAFFETLFQAAHLPR